MKKSIILKDRISSMISEKFADNAEYILNDCTFNQSLDSAMRIIDNESCNTEYELSLNYYLNDLFKKAEWIHSHVLTPATVKVGEGATVCLWTDCHAGTIIDKTKYSITIRRDKAILNPEFKPEFIARGFFGTVINQDEQKYTYEPNENGVIYKLRWSKKHNRYGQPNGFSVIKGRKEFYDYNF